MPSVSLQAVWSQLEYVQLPLIAELYGVFLFCFSPLPRITWPCLCARLAPVHERGRARAGAYARVSVHARVRVVARAR